MAHVVNPFIAIARGDTITVRRNPTTGCIVIKIGDRLEQLDIMFQDEEEAQKFVKGLLDGMTFFAGGAR
jgi:hypothetical protein